MLGFTTRFAGIPQPTTSHLQKGAAVGSACCLFAVGSLLFRCSLGCYSFLYGEANQGFCGEPDIGG
jgi:hypothetical protein